MAQFALDWVLGFIIGLSLGLLGGGGSILTVPALVYLVGQSPQAAVTTSLAIVGANSVLGAFFHSAQGSLNGRVALLFGGAGMAAAYLAAGFSDLFSPAALLVAFALLMLVIGGLMVFQANRRQEPRPEKPPHVLLILSAGAGVGVLTGILGVGGGFLIVPALVMLLNLPVYQAVGTSLVIIAANSLAGFVGHLNHQSIDASLILIFIGAGLAGTFFGSRLARRLPANQLRLAFGLFVAVLAVFLLSDNMPKL